MEQFFGIINEKQIHPLVWQPLMMWLPKGVIPFIEKQPSCPIQHPLSSRSWGILLGSLQGTPWAGSHPAPLLEAAAQRTPDWPRPPGESSTDPAVGLVAFLCLCSFAKILILPAK